MADREGNRMNEKVLVGVGETSCTIAVSNQMTWLAKAKTLGAKRGANSKR